MTTTHNVCWALWIFGTGLIVSSWLEIVPSGVGWVGFAIAATGSFVSFNAQQKRLRQLPPRPEPAGDETLPQA